jgi:hypothetical protein
VDCIFEATTVAITDVFGETTFAHPLDGRCNMFRHDSHATAGLSPLFLSGSARQKPMTRRRSKKSIFLPTNWRQRRVSRGAPDAASARLRRRGAVAAPAAECSDAAWPDLDAAPPSPLGNWFPLLPVTIGRLALGVLWNARNQKPAGRVLADLRPSALLLHQEEVPSQGAQIVRRWQSARATDGSLHFWIGRNKTPRRTDIALAICFDLVEWK